LHVCAEHKKARKLLTTLQNIGKEDGENKRTRSLGIIFCATIEKVKYLAKLLSKERNMPPCAELHSHLGQSERERAVQNFQCGKVPLLIATDIAARGIHVNRVKFVINYDFPGNLEQYVHRCGRAGRGARNNSMMMEARVYSFFTRNMAPLAADMVALLEAGQQVVDPNLRELVVQSEKQQQKRAAKRNERKPGRYSANEKRPKVAKRDDGGATSDDDDDDDDEHAFQHLSAKRIVLKRAPNISDASSSDEESSSSEDQ